MPPKRTVSHPAPGEQKNQDLIRTGIVTFTATTFVDLKRAIRRKNQTTAAHSSFAVIGLVFLDAGGVATTMRLSAVEDATAGGFRIYCSKDTAAAGVMAAATNPCTVRWTALLTE